MQCPQQVDQDPRVRSSGSHAESSAGGPGSSDSCVRPLGSCAGSLESGIGSHVGSGTSASHAWSFDNGSGSSTSHARSPDENPKSPTFVDLTSSPSSVEREDEKLSKLQFVERQQEYEIAPSYSRAAVDTLTDVVEASEALDILLNGAKADSILFAVSEAKLTGKPKNLHVGDDPFTIAEAYYKGKVDMTRPLYVIFPGMSAIDAGGPSKQFLVWHSLDFEEIHSYFREAPTASCQFTPLLLYIVVYSEYWEDLLPTHYCQMDLDSLTSLLVYIDT